MSDGLHPETLIQHLGEEDHSLGAVIPPLYQNSLFVFPDFDAFNLSSQGKSEFHGYSRITNPTLDVAEKKIAALEKTDQCKLFTSGMAAISAAVLNSISQGDHVVCVDTVYGPTRDLFSRYVARFGVEVTYVEGSDPEGWARASRPNTKVFYLESPSSLVFKLQDLRAVSLIAKEKDITTIIDNSYSSPIFQQPATMGVDIVVHSASKYLGGHSDLVAGALCTDNDRMKSIIKDEVNILGGTINPFGAWLITRAMRTLPLRLRAVEKTAQEVATALQSHPKVIEVFHVGLADFAQASLRDAQMSGTGGLFSFRPKFQTEQRMREFFNALKIFQIGVSWGGHESLAVPLFLQPMDWSQKQYVIRLYTGLEHPEDLIDDLMRALDAVND